jgi:hypothetical protein
MGANRNSVEVNKTEARQGITGQGVRYVLVGGLILAGLALGIFMIMFR